MQGAFQVFLRYAGGQGGANLGLIRKDLEMPSMIPAACLGRQGRANAALTVVQNAKGVLRIRGGFDALTHGPSRGPSISANRTLRME
jgi:hypothetical protein